MVIEGDGGVETRAYEEDGAMLGKDRLHLDGLFPVWGLQRHSCEGRNSGCLLRSDVIIGRCHGFLLSQE